MTQNQASSGEQKRLTKEQKTLIARIMIWSAFIALIPILGIPVTWLFAKKLEKSQKFIVTAIGIVSWVLLSNYEPVSQPNAGQESPQPTITQTQPESVRSVKAVPVGTWTNVRGDRAIQVTESEIVSQIVPNNEFASPVQSKGGKLVVVYIGLKNTGRESGNMFWSNFNLVDDQDRKYAEIEDFEELVSINMWIEGQGLEETDNQMFPGATVKTAKVFRVAPDASNLKLIINDRLFEIQADNTSILPGSSVTPATKSTSSTLHSSAPTIRANDGHANLRVQPSTEVDVIAKLPNGNSVNILDEQTNSAGQLWYKVEAGGKVGWVFSDLLDSGISSTSGAATTVTARPLPSSANLEQSTASSSGSKKTSFSAMIERKGLDFSYKVPGKVEETEQSIILTHTHTWECSAEFSAHTGRQEWQTTFDLASKTWTDKVRELSNCLGNTNQGWMDFSTTPNRFNIETRGSETIIRADSQDTDGSIIVKDALVVRYTKQ